MTIMSSPWTTATGLIIVFTFWPLVTVWCNAQELGNVPRSNVDELGTVLRYQLGDNVPAHTLVGEVGRDSGLFADRQALFTLWNEPPPFFEINPTSGTLTTKSAIDRDAICPSMESCQLETNVRVGRGQTSNFIKVKVVMVDENDNAPTFERKEFRRSVSEGASSGTPIPLPVAYDVDSLSAGHGVKGYHIGTVSGKSVLEVFELGWSNQTTDDLGGGPEEVYLILLSRLDREQTDSYAVQLIAYDGGTPSRSATTSIVVDVTDINDNSPVFDRRLYEATVPEDVDIPVVVLRVGAVDPDDGVNGEVRYELERRRIGSKSAAAVDDREPFEVDAETGEIRLIGRLDFESRSQYSLTVIARDLGPGAVPTRARVVIRVTDVNDNSPNVRIRTLDGAPAAHVTESLPAGAFVAHVTIADPDPIGGQFDCRLTAAEDDGEANHFRLEKIFRSEYKIVTASELDREKCARYNLSVVCRDDDGAAPQTGTGNVTVVVVDVNDNAPMFERKDLKAEVGENAPSGTLVIRMAAVDADEGQHAAIRYFVDPAAGFVVDPETGWIRTTRSFDHERQADVRLTVTSKDGGVPSLTSSVDVLVHIIDVDDEVFSCIETSCTELSEFERSHPVCQR